LASVDSLTVTAPLPAAILWDMDGTIVDTEPYWMLAEHALVGSFGKVWSQEDGMLLVGSSLERSAGILRSRGVDLGVEEIIERLTDEVMVQLDREILWRPGALELITAQATLGIPAALVTMSTRRMAERISYGLGFATLVTWDDVERGKPDPEAYLTAAAALGVDIRDCVIVEDSIPGVASALASGAAVIGVPAHVHLAEQEQLTIWPTLEGRTIEDVAAVLAARVA
jgi:beta-phosphoglucomutase-like phosphatase (HAD superfamily)